MLSTPRGLLPPGQLAAAAPTAYAIISGVVTSPRVMRQMPRLLQGAGLQLVASFPYFLAEVGRADFWVPAIESFRRLVPKSGAMTEEEANAGPKASLRLPGSESFLAPATTTATSPGGLVGIDCRLPNSVPRVEEVGVGESPHLNAIPTGFQRGRPANEALPCRSHLPARDMTSRLGGQSCR